MDFLRGEEALDVGEEGGWSAREEGAGFDYGVCGPGSGAVVHFWGAWGFDVGL